MAATDLPVPGLLWGRYPERQAHDAPADWLRSLRRAAATRAPGYRTRAVARVRMRERGLLRLDEGQLASVVHALRVSLRRDGLRADHVAQAFAVMSVQCARTLASRPYDSQLIAAHIVLDSTLAEMATGEGKTLAVGIAAGTAALAGVPVHVITANDHLVVRDADHLRPAYAALGLSTGAVVQGQDADERRAAYACDITYTTARELVFDYLRDGLTRRRDPLQSRVQQVCGGHTEPLLRGLCLAIIDEADSILIDEARTPFVLSRSQPGVEEACYLDQSLSLARTLAEGTDFTLDAGLLDAALTPAGRERIEQASVSLGPVWRNRLHREEAISTALAALHLYHRDQHYLVREGQVVIIDHTTGRIAPGRAWSRGLHQLIEMKEGCRRTVPAVTAAQITYQRFFPRYLRLGGVSGTLIDSRRELRAVYGLDVGRGPLRRPDQRVTLPTRLFASTRALQDGVIVRARDLQRSGRPVIVATDSVADSEALSLRLTEAGLDHAVLNARHHRDEAQIIARAGARGAITITTNMAGRGTDIPLAEGVSALGGLHIVCCQLNAARRIDRQLAGRAARQGDPGSVETWLSPDTPLAASQLPAWMRALARRQAAHVPGWLAHAIARLLQRREERCHLRQRQRLLRHDENLDRGLSMRDPMSDGQGAM
jgi:preprotein translocase subunit SecA